MVVEDGDSAVSFNSNRLTLLGVLDSNVKSGTGGSTGNSGNAQSSRKKAFSDLEETSLNVFDVTGEDTLFIDVTIPVHHVDSGNSHIREFKGSIVDSVHAEFLSHIVHSHSRKYFEGVLVTDGHHKSIDTFVLTINDSLSENQSVVGVLEPVRNPVFLGEDRRCVDHKFLRSFVVRNSSLHLDCVVSVTELSQAEASEGTQVVDLVEVVLVSLSREGISRSTEEVELNCEFNRTRVIYHG